MIRSFKLALVYILFIVPLILSGSPVHAEEGSSEVDLHVTVIGPPLVVTCPANGIGTTKATLNGYLTGMGTASTVKVSFGWDTVSHAGNPEAYSHWTYPQVKRSPGKFKVRLDNLKPGTTYYFRAKATGDTISYGEELSFTTSPHGYHWYHGWWNRWNQWWGKMNFWHRK